MKVFSLLVGFTLAAAPSILIAQAPLTQIGTLVMPEVPPGPYIDHLTVDLAGHRLFTTPQANKAVDAIDLTSGKVIKVISGFGNPHSVFYREDTAQLFVTDGGVGALKVFDGKDYHLIKQIPLLKDADGLAYDPKTKYLYVSNGGEGAEKRYSLITIVDTSSLEVKGEIRLDADKLEATLIDPNAPIMYADLPGKNELAVIDLQTKRVVKSWPVAPGRSNMALAYDPATHRLFIGCRNTDVRGSVIVMDSTTGKVLQSLPIGGWVDQIEYDFKRKRLYASCGTGQVFTFGRTAQGSYRPLPSTDTAVLAKTALLVPAIDLLFVSAPHLGESDARVLVFRVN